MTHLLDTNICSAHMRRPAGLAHRFIQYSGGMAVSSVSLAELFAGANQHPNPAKIFSLIADLLTEVSVLNFDSAAADEYGKQRGDLNRRGIAVSMPDLMIASIALVHNLTLVTNNTSDFANIAGLRLDDWLVP